MPESLTQGEATPKQYAVLAQEVGGPEWPDLDYGILLELVQDRTGSLTPVAQAKLFFTQEVSGEPPYRSMKDPWLFEKLVCAFSGMVPDFEVWQVPSPEDVVEAVYRLQELKGEGFQLPQEVWRFVAATLAHGGCWMPPPGLEEAEEPIRLYMKQRGVTLPDRAAVLAGKTDDARQQLSIWRSAAERLR